MGIVGFLYTTDETYRVNNYVIHSMSTVNSLLERTKQSTYVLQFADDIKYAIFLKKERITF
jgi:hypothetical protein